ncbi:MAG: D-alanyl-D-alanine carboxypeptidase [Parcubacteria group bacterium]|nr:D-alanyl-D-alanine carboxypeptidase [Parcubacteria group bacterium]
MNERTGQRIALLAFLVFAFWAGRFLWAPSAPLEEKNAEMAPPDPFASVSLAASAAVVFDVARGVTLFERNAEAQLPLASLAKLMTAYVAAETIAPDTEIAMTKSAVEKEGDNGFLVGEKWRRNDLIAATLLSSSNDGAAALAEEGADGGGGGGELPAGDAKETFVGRMNAAAHSLGLAQTFFVNETGLDINTAISGAYGSAIDVAKLGSALLARNPELFVATARAEGAFVSSDGKKHSLKNTNEIVETIPGIVASKTGFTDLAGGNLAVIFEAGPMRPVAVVVLGSTADARFADAEMLVWATIRAIAR